VAACDTGAPGPPEQGRLADSQAQEEQGEPQATADDVRGSPGEPVADQ
jgi:hypothetical protein